MAHLDSVTVVQRYDAEDCPRCIRSRGLCDRHTRGILPELARNIGWLKLMGETVVEQKRLQAREDAATAKAKRREARKATKRGVPALLAAIRSAA